MFCLDFKCNGKGDFAIAHKAFLQKTVNIVENKRLREEEMEGCASWKTDMSALLTLNQRQEPLLARGGGINFKWGVGKRDTSFISSHFWFGFDLYNLRIPYLKCLRPKVFQIYEFL